ncbi:MAG TPA: hypothetical protein VMI74_15395 [Burkholderiales bacterium]|nr:hypothetical protein [Burkholderiales bacterium]
MIGTARRASILSGAIAPETGAIAAIRSDSSAPSLYAIMAPFENPVA